MNAATMSAKRESAISNPPRFSEHSFGRSFNSRIPMFSRLSLRSTEFYNHDMRLPNAMIPLQQVAGQALRLVAIRCGTKWLRKAGKQILVPDWPARKIMRWIAHIRFVHGLSFQKIAERLEEILSKREGRRYVPEHGVRSRNKIQRQHSRGVVRKWSCTKVRKAIPLVRELWPELYGDEPLSRTAAKAE